MNSKLKTFNTALAAGLVFTLLLSLVSFDSCCEDLRENVFRLHIIANSDSVSDQQLKLKVRDAILKESEDLFCGETTFDGAVERAENSTARISEIAEKTLKENGCDYPVSVSVGKADFNTRVYDDFTLPAGEYEALRVKIGNASGKNWWCVLFPEICVGATGKLSDTANKNAVGIAEGKGKFVVKFKIVELYEGIKAKICKK